MAGPGDASDERFRALSGQLVLALFSVEARASISSDLVVCYSTSIFQIDCAKIRSKLSLAVGTACGAHRATILLQSSAIAGRPTSGRISGR